ncbi:MAG: helix-turn-helix transcriptional regulator [Bacilli bacterium]|nr:helix-turn-helix transcriptional regulator [Bacilli bacterium]
MENNISIFVKEKRKEAKLTQKEFSILAGVGLAFIRAIEQGKTTLKVENVNKVLAMFGYELGPVEKKR